MCKMNKKLSYYRMDEVRFNSENIYIDPYKGMY